jgi:hypothetical protein
MKNKIAQFTIRSFLYISLLITLAFAGAFASCNAIADTSGLNLNPDTVWIRLVPDKAVDGKAKLVLDFSKPIPGLTPETSKADLAALFAFNNGVGMSYAEEITPVSITKDSGAVYTLTVQNVPDSGQGMILVTINKAGIAPSTRPWSLDGEVYEISLRRTDGGGALNSAKFYEYETVTGFGAQTALSVTVANTGTAPTGALNITLSGADAAQFSLSVNTLASIDSGGADEKTFDVKPNPGIDVGDYIALVTVSGGNSIEASFTVRLSVVVPPLWSHNKTQLDDLPEYYVCQNGRGDRDGRDWDNAVNKFKLFDVLAKAAARTSTTKVYVAAGTYIPWNTHGNSAPTGNAASFPLASNVAVYGGFANGLSGTVNPSDMSAREERFNVDGSGAGFGTINAAAVYETVLSGDLKGDDLYVDGCLSGGDADNVYHVVSVAVGTNAAAMLDGFTITGGNAAEQSFDGGSGGGIFNYASENDPSSPSFARLTIIGNKAGVSGGGMLNLYSSSTISNVTIADNLAGGGAGMTNYYSSLTLTKVTIWGNKSSEDSDGGIGGGICNLGSSPVLNYVHIKGNQTNSGGGGIGNSSSSPVLTNVLITDNTARGGGGICNRSSSSPVLTNVLIEGNKSTLDGDGSGGGGIYNSGNSAPVLTNMIIRGNEAVNGGGGIMNFSSSSPILTNVAITGNVARAGGGIGNSDSSPILTNVTIAGNRADSGGGIVNRSGTATPLIRNSIIWGNTADIGANVYNSPASEHFPLSCPSWTNSLVQGSAGGWTDFGANDGNNIDGDPLFESAASADSAPTSAGDYRLRSGSPAANSGSNALYDSQPAPSAWTAAVIVVHSQWSAFLAALKDLAGNPRKTSVIDMGAFER